MTITPPFYKLRQKLQRTFVCNAKRLSGLTVVLVRLKHLKTVFVGSWAALHYEGEAETETKRLLPERHPLLVIGIGSETSLGIGGRLTRTMIENIRLGHLSAAVETIDHFMRTIAITQQIVAQAVVLKPTIPSPARLTLHEPALLPHLGLKHLAGLQPLIETSKYHALRP